MSLIIRCEGREIWEPSLRCGRPFRDQVRSLERLFHLESGIGPIEADEIELDAERFRAFVEACLAELATTSNGPIYAMSAGAVQVAVVLYHRLFGT